MYMRNESELTKTKKLIKIEEIKIRTQMFIIFNFFKIVSKANAELSKMYGFAVLFMPKSGFNMGNWLRGRVFDRGGVADDC